MTISRRMLTIILVALAVSLSVNFAGVGFLAARFHFHRGPPDMMRIVQLGLGGLPPALRELVAKELAAQRPEMTEELRRVREARRALIEAMRAEPFDRARVETAFAALGAQLVAIRRHGEEAVIRALERSTPEDRAAIREPRGPVPDLGDAPPPRPP